MEFLLILSLFVAVVLVLVVPAFSSKAAPRLPAPARATGQPDREPQR